MERLLNGLDRFSTKRNLILGIISAFIVVSIMGALTQMLVYDVYGDANMPDTNFGYTFLDIQTAFDTLGSEGLQMWLQVHLLDLIFPLTYAFSMVFGIMMELRATVPDKRNLRLLALLPIGGAIADYIENILIASQAISYPEVSPQIIAIASIVTILKWVLLYVAFAIVFILLIILVIKQIIQRKRDN